MTLTISNLPDDLHERLQHRARQHGRSLEDEVVACLRQRVDENRTGLLERIRARRATLHQIHLTDEILEQAIDCGRA